MELHKRSAPHNIQSLTVEDGGDSMLIQRLRRDSANCQVSGNPLLITSLLGICLIIAGAVASTDRTDPLANNRTITHRNVYPRDNLKHLLLRGSTFNG